MDHSEPPERQPATTAELDLSRFYINRDEPHYPQLRHLDCGTDSEADGYVDFISRGRYTVADLIALARAHRCGVDDDQ